MKDVNLNSLKIFLVVATSNSFLEASNKLYISQPAISKSINKLEEDLGISLFYRANKGVTLTVLVVTIIVIIILAGVTISSSDSLIKNTKVKKV